MFRRIQAHFYLEIWWCPADCPDSNSESINILESKRQVRITSSSMFNRSQVLQKHPSHPSLFYQQVVVKLLGIFLKTTFCSSTHPPVAYCSIWLLWKLFQSQKIRCNRGNKCCFVTSKCFFWLIQNKNCLQKLLKKKWSDRNKEMNTMFRKSHCHLKRAYFNSNLIAAFST